MSFSRESWPSMVSQSWQEWGVDLGGPGPEPSCHPTQLQHIPVDPIQCPYSTATWQMTPKLHSSRGLFIRLELRQDMIGMAFLCFMKSEAPAGRLEDWRLEQPDSSFWGLALDGSNAKIANQAPTQGLSMEPGFLIAWRPQDLCYLESLSSWCTCSPRCITYKTNPWRSHHRCLICSIDPCSHELTRNRGDRS